THYPASRQQAMEITKQEAWTEREAGQIELSIPEYVREVVEEVAFLARQDQKVDKRSGVSQRLPISLLENVISNAERRALATGEQVAVPRITDIYAAIPAITGKFELEYEGELKGADNVARELIRGAVATVYDGWHPDADMRQVTTGSTWADRCRWTTRCRRPNCSRGRDRCRGSTTSRAPAPGARRRIRCSPRRWTSCSKGSTRTARSAARTRDSSRPPSSRRSSARRGRSTRSPSAICRSPETRRSTTTDREIPVHEVHRRRPRRDRSRGPAVEAVRPAARQRVRQSLRRLRRRAVGAFHAVAARRDHGGDPQRRDAVGRDAGTAARQGLARRRRRGTAPRSVDREDHREAAGAGLLERPA